MLAKIAWRNLFLHGRKSVAALLSIALASIALSLFSGYIHNVRRLYDATFARRQMLGDLVVERAGIKHPGKAGLDEQALDVAEQAWLDAYLKDHHVQNRVRFLNISGFISSGQVSDIFLGLAFDPAEGARLRGPDYEWSTYAGVPLERAHTQPAVLVGRNLSEILGCEAHAGELNGTLGYVPEERPFTCPNTTVQLQVNTESGQSNAMDFYTAGLIATGFTEIDAHLVMMPLAEAQRLFHTQRVSYVSVELEGGEDIGEWVRKFHQAANVAHVPVHGVTWKEHSYFGDLFRNSMEFLELFRDFVVAILLMVVTMAIINTFVRIVYERLHELGTLRSIGYRPWHIIGIFGYEAIFLALAGSLVGLAGAYVLAFWCNRLNFLYDAGFLSEGVPFRIDLALGDFVWITGVVVGITVGSTVLASWRVSHMLVADILRER